jgi:single-stranded-DNA-specific exonuclease
VLANELDALNQTRKEIEQGMQAEALTLCESWNAAAIRCRAAGDVPSEWHQGVVGILASRIKELPSSGYRLCPTGDGTLKGSGLGLHMRDALERLDTLYPG